MKVKLSWAEKFINWFPKNTKLYLRGERGKTAQEADALYRELFMALLPFMEKLRLDAVEDCAQCQERGGRVRDLKEER